tara:strand:- start:1257 stop:1706 length:450 start_codon:yes stop_codon:yes gene_type:complete
MKNIHLLSIVFVSFCLFGCNNQDASDTYQDIKSDQVPTNFDNDLISIDYEILNLPKINETVLVNLLISSADKTEEIYLNYQIMIEEDLKFNENQLRDIKISPKSDGTDHNLQVSLIPLRKGRVFFVISATINYEKKSLAKTLSIPLNVN